MTTVEGEIFIYNEKSGELRGVIHAFDYPRALPNTVEFRCDGKFISADPAFGTGTVPGPNGTRANVKIDDPIRIWRVRDGQMAHSIKGDFGEISQLAWSPDGKLLAALTGDRELRIWETAQFRLVLGPASTPCHYAIGFKPDGTQLAIATGSSIKILSLDDSKLTVRQ